MSKGIGSRCTALINSKPFTWIKTKNYSYKKWIVVSQLNLMIVISQLTTPSFNHIPCFLHNFFAKFNVCPL